MKITPLTQRRLHNFRSNKRGYWSLWIFLGLFVLSLFAEFIANDKPFLIYYDGGFYTPVFKDYPETTFGGPFETRAEYKRPLRSGADQREGLDALADHPLQPPDRRLGPAGAGTLGAPTAEHWLGTDDQARDVLARLIYGFRISVLFGLVC